MGPHFQRAALLYDQRRYDLAEEELRRELGEDPQSAAAHGLLALCLSAREKFDEATGEAGLAVHLAPDDPMSHYAMGRVMFDRGRLAEAAAAAQEAARLDPEDPDYWALLAQVRYEERRWPAALESAERGLESDAEHVGCNNLRAMALIKLGRRREAGATLDAALARDPEDALSHANRGWTLLEQSEPAKAMEHFREALRLDPTLDWARAGIVEALKARNVVYRWMLRYFLWMSKLSGRAQWAVVIGAYLVYQLLGSLARSNPRWAPFLSPILWAYGLFALMTWLAGPLFNLMLRLNRFGRLALSKEQVAASNAVGLCLLAALALSAAWFASGSGDFLFVAAFFGILTLPVAGVYRCPEGWPRRVMTLYLAGLIAVGLAFFALVYVPGLPGRGPLLPWLFWTFLLGAFLSQWVINGLILVRVRR
jgi:tetratricopeptide (TPR) repeat protein